MQKITVFTSNLNTESAKKSHFCIKRNHGECKKNTFYIQLKHGKCRRITFADCLADLHLLQLDLDTACQQM